MNAESQPITSDESNILVPCRQCAAPIDADLHFCPHCGMSTQGDLPPDPLVGRVVGDRYRIIRLVGRGGMGVVYRCEHTKMGKAMAIKLLHGELARDPEVQRRFRREAQAASRLSHPNTVSIFDFGTSDGLMYLVMEYVHGEDLGKILRVHGIIPATRAVAIAAQACGSLTEAHDHGITHRDLKPENLLVSSARDGQEFVKLLDFGLAKLREGEERNEISSANQLVGTPYYMAPEVIRGHNADHRVDIYALGAVLYRAICGSVPFTGTSPVAVLTKHVTDELVLPSRKRPDLDIPPTLDQIVGRCMQKDPALRYSRIDDLRKDLIAYLSQEGVSESALRVSGGIIATVSSPPSSADTPTRTDKRLTVATRDDVEAFERSIRKGKVFWRILSIVMSLLLVGGIAGWLRYRAIRNAALPRDSEVEPNDLATQATAIVPNVDVSGRIGAKLGETQGDVDFYRLADLPPGEWNLRVEVSGTPHIDTVLELYRTDIPDAVTVADDGVAGEREVIAGFRVRDTSYYLSVHEVLAPGEKPKEAVTYTYTLRYTLQAVDPSVELEPNNRREVAMEIRPSARITGYIESRRDVDYFCPVHGSGSMRVTVTPPEGLNIALRIDDGSEHAVTDRHSVGQAENALLQPLPNETTAPCVIVQLSDNNQATNGATVHGDPDHPYTLTVSRE